MVQLLNNATTRRLLAVLASLLMLIGLMAGPLSGMLDALAEDKPTVSIGDFSVRAGDTFDVPIVVSGNPGIVSLAFKVGFDANVFELVGKQNGIFDGDYSFGPNFQQNPYKMNWTNALSTEDITTNGTYMTLTFKVKDDAVSGDYKFTYEYNPLDIFNFDFEDVVFDFVSGTVTVDGVEPVCEHAYDDDFDTTCNKCGETRVLEPIVSTASFYGWKNEDTWGYSTKATGLEKDKKYTLSFLWKAEAGVPYFYVGSKNTRVVEGMKALNGASIDYTTGRVEYEFVGTGEPITIGTMTNSNQASNYGYTKYNFGDVVIMDENGEVAFRANTAPNESRGWGWADWGDSWGGVKSTLTIENKFVSFFAGTACTHSYANDCDTDCNTCGARREVEGHAYDNENDATCNKCGDVRDLSKVVSAATAYGWKNEDTLGWITTVKGLEKSAAYTLSFYWKAEKGLPYFYVGDKNVRAVEGMKAQNGASIDYTTGLVTYKFNAPSENVGMGFIMNTAAEGAGGYAKVFLADVVITDAEGNEVYRNDTSVHETRGWGWADWAGNWGGVRSTLDCVDQKLSFFAGTACAHNYRNDCDKTCETCGTPRDVEGHTYDNDDDATCNKCGDVRDLSRFVNAVSCYGWSNEDTMGWAGKATGLTKGAKYTLKFYWNATNGAPYFYLNDLSERVIEGMEPKNGATIDRSVGLVTYEFTAPSAEFGMGFVMNTVAGGYGMVYMADVVILDAEGNEVYRNDTTVDEERGWGWTGWNSRWGAVRSTLAFEDVRVSFFNSAPETLTELKVEGATLSTEFNTWTYDYNLTVPATTTALNITATPFAGKTVEIIGNGGFTPDSYTDVLVNVTSATGETVTYTLHVRISPLSREALSSLTIAGYDFAFDPLVYDYTLTVPHSQGELDFSWVLGADAKAGTTPVVKNNGSFKQEKTTDVVISVENNDGVITNYTISVYMLKDPWSIVNAVQIKEWNQDVQASTKVKLKKDTNYLVSFLFKEVTGNKVNVIISGDALLGAKKEIVSLGTATENVDFDPETGLHEYFFTAKGEELTVQITASNYNRPDSVPMFEAWIADIQIREVDENGNVVEGGHDAGVDNTYVLDNTNTEESEGAWSRSSWGGNFWNIKRNVERTYFAMEYFLLLDGITVDGNDVEGFHPAKFSYFLAVPYTVPTMLIEPTLGDDGESYVILDAEGNEVGNEVTLVEGRNVFTIVVTNYDQTTGNYKITVDKAYEPEAAFESLTVNGGTLSPEFSPLVMEYTATIPFEMTAAEFDYVLTENATLQSITGNENLQVGIPTTVMITLVNGNGRLTTYVIEVTREGKDGADSAVQSMVNEAMANITVNDYTTKEDLTAMLAEQINNSDYTVAVVDFYRLRSVTEVKDNFGVLIEGKPGYLAAVVNVTDGESLAQVSVNTLIPFETKEYTFAEDEVSTEADFIMSDGPDGLIVDFYVGGAKKIVIPDGVVELAYGWLDPEDIEGYQVIVFPDSVKVLPDDMLLGSYGLETVVFGDGLTELSTGACAKLPNLQFVRLPANLKTITGYAFDCSVSLASIRIPDSVTAIEGNAFYFTLMREITVPASVTYIGKSAFAASFSAAEQLNKGNDNTARWYPFASADDPRIAVIQERLEKEVDWYGTMAGAPVCDTLAEAREAQGGKYSGIFGHMMSSPKVVTVLNKDVEIEANPFGGRGLWCDGGCNISIAYGTPNEENIQAWMDAQNESIDAQYAGIVGTKWSTRDMTIAEVGARAMFALDKLVIGGNFTEDDVLAAIAPDYFTSQVTAAIDGFAVDAESGKVSGTLVLKQGNITMKIALDKEVDGDYVAPDQGNEWITITDGKVVTLKGDKLLVAPGTTLEAVFGALNLAEGVEIDFYDHKGSYIAPEYYSIAVIRDGFKMDILQNGEVVSTLTFDYNGEGNIGGDDEGNTGTGVTSVATTMIVLMAAATVALVVFRRKKVTE